MKGLSGMTKDLLVKEHPELAAQAGLLKQTKVNKEKKRKQYFHEGIVHRITYWLRTIRKYFRRKACLRMGSVAR